MRGYNKIHHMSDRSVFLVDVDNLYIVRNKVNIPLLTKRIAHITSTHKNVRWFGNTFTAKVIHNNDTPKIRLIISNIDKDTADHAILEYLRRREKQLDEAYIVSNDKSLSRLAWLMFPSIKIHPVTYSSVTSTEAVIAPVMNKLSFSSRVDVEKFIKSYTLFVQRYGQHP